MRFQLCHPEAEPTFDGVPCPPKHPYRTHETGKRESIAKKREPYRGLSAEPSWSSLGHETGNLFRLAGPDRFPVCAVARILSFP
jgi:hypothetical protein